MKHPQTDDQFAAGGVLLENKALRIGDTNKQNAEQAMRFARTEDERRAIRLEELKATAREIEARQAGDESTEDTDDTKTITEDVPCSD